MGRHLTRIALVSVIAVMFGCATVAAQELKKLNLDDASSIGLEIQTDALVKVEGRASVKIITPWPTTVCLAEVSGLEVDEAKLLYSEKIKSDLEGEAFLEMWVQVDSGKYFSKGMNDAVQGISNWKTIQTLFIFQKGQRPSKVTLNVVINGKGTLWVDDIILSKEPLK